MKTFLKLTSWILVTMLIFMSVGCGKQASDKTTKLTLSFSYLEEERNYILSVERSEKNIIVNRGDFIDQFVYTVTVKKDRGSEQSPLTTQVFTIYSEIDDPSAIIEFADINHDDCPDLLVRTLQTIHSAAWYDAYRFIPEEGRFEAEPFFTYLSSGLPQCIGDNQLMTMQSTASETECELYRIGNDNRYHHLRSYFAERYDGTQYTVTDYTSEDSKTLYQQHFDGELTIQDTLKIYSLFFYGDTFSYLNHLMNFAEDYCFLRENGGKPFENARHMLLDNPSLLEQEQAYFAAKDSSAECIPFVTGISEAIGDTLRIYITCFIHLPETQAYQTKHLAVDLEYDSIYYGISVSSINDAPPSDENAEVFCAAEYEQDTDSYQFYWYDAEHQKIRGKLENGKFSLSHARYVDENVIEFHQDTGTGVWYSQYFRTDSHEASQSLPNAIYLGHDLALYPNQYNEFSMVNVYDEKAYSYSFSTGVFPANTTDFHYLFTLVDNQHIKMSTDYERGMDRIITIPAVPGM